MLLSMNFSKKKYYERALWVKYSLQSWIFVGSSLLALESQKAQSWPAWAHGKRGNPVMGLRNLFHSSTTSHQNYHLIAPPICGSTSCQSSVKEYTDFYSTSVQNVNTTKMNLHFFLSRYCIGNCSTKIPHLVRFFNCLKVIKWVDFKESLKQEFSFLFHR